MIVLGSGPPLLPSSSTLNAQLRRELKRAKHIGVFDSEVNAARAYNRKALEMYGDLAGINTDSECRGWSAPPCL